MLVSIAKLANDGFDFSTRVLARSTGEHLDLVRYLSYFPCACAEFITEDPASANLFWYRSLSKQKAQKQFFQMILEPGRSLGQLDSELASLSQWEAEREKFYSLFVHPSWLGGMVSILGTNDANEDHTIVEAVAGGQEVSSDDVLEFVNWKAFLFQQIFLRSPIITNLRDEGFFSHKNELPSEYLPVARIASRNLAVHMFP
jgi:hypothetical protein